MQIFVEPTINQVMAVYKGCRSDSAPWTAQGFTEYEVPDGWPASRDVTLTLVNGEPVGVAPNPNPFDPPPPTLDEIDTAALNKLLVAEGSILRAFALLLLDETNLHAARITAVLDAADAATSLADFKTRMGAINDLPQRTTAQLKDALKVRMRN